jgi:hypothetical protein
LDRFEQVSQCEDALGSQRSLRRFTLSEPSTDKRSLIYSQ